MVWFLEPSCATVSLAKSCVYMCSYCSSSFLTLHKTVINQGVDVITVQKRTSVGSVLGHTVIDNKSTHLEDYRFCLISDCWSSDTKSREFYTRSIQLSYYTALCADVFNCYLRENDLIASVHAHEVPIRPYSSTKSVYPTTINGFVLG